MDLQLPEWAQGGGIGAGLVGLAWTLAKALQRRSEGAAAQDEAGAKAVVELVAQLADLRADLNREQVARERLEQELKELRDEVEEEKSKRLHYESQVMILQGELNQERRERQQAEGWAKSLAAELAELRRQIQGSHTIPSSVPRK